MRHLKPLLKDALIALAFVIGASAAGILFNLVSSRGIDPFAPYTGYGDVDPNKPDELPAVGITEPIAVHEALDIGGAVFVDARPREEYEAGHIPGAVSLPYSLMRMMPADQGGGYSDEELAPLKAACTAVIYDAGDGSAESTHAAIRDRIPVLRVLTGGVEAWKQAGGAWSGGAS